MKKNILFFAVTILSLALMSNQRGRGSASGPATGAPEENRGTCGNSGCHSSGSFNPALDVKLLDLDGNQVDEYLPRENYTVSLKINHTGLPAGYGFQMVCLNDDENLPINNFFDLPQSVKAITLMVNRQYVEHSTRIPVDSISIPWIAPEKETGPVTFYVAANAVNGNSSPSGDGTDNGAFSFNEALGSSTTELDQSSIVVYPNPATDIIRFDSDRTIKLIEVYDIFGNRQTLSYQTSLDLVNYTPGTYVARITTSDGQSSSQIFIKN